MIKKHIWVMLLPALLSGTLYAQERLDFAVNKTVIPKKVHFKTSSFQVEDKCILEVDGAIPNSIVEFYSTPHGGKLLKRDVLNNNGKLQITFEAEKSPSFVLNTSKSYNGSAKGTGFVQYLDQKDFIIRDINMVKEGNVLSIRFESLTNPDKEVSYELVSLDETGKQEVIHVFTPNEDKDWEMMDFEYALAPRTKYRFVVKSGDTERYARELYNSEGQNDYIVYPSITDNEIYVEFKQATEHSPYTITDVKGVVISSGEITDLKTEIQISDFAGGTYFIRLDKYPNDGIQFIKR